MTTIATHRLYLLRAGYLLIAVGLASWLWPSMPRVAGMELMHGAVTCMLCALSILAILGLRYPLQMLPLLFWEMAWKAIWLGTVAWPRFTAHRLDQDTVQFAIACLMVAIFPIIVPWDYIVANYVTRAGDPWWRLPSAGPGVPKG